MVGRVGSAMSAKSPASTPSPILDVLDKGYIPVVSTVGCDDEGGNVYNINADTAAARIAGRAGRGKPHHHDRHPRASCATTTTNATPHPHDARVGDARRCTSEGVISGGMIPKVECCIEAMRRGVQKRCSSSTGACPTPSSIEMLTDEGVGHHGHANKRRLIAAYELHFKELDRRVYRAHLRAAFPLEIVSGHGRDVSGRQTAKQYIDLGSGIARQRVRLLRTTGWVAAVSRTAGAVRSTPPTSTIPRRASSWPSCFASARGMTARVLRQFRRRGQRVRHQDRAANTPSINTAPNSTHIIVTLNNSFHGRTITTLAATGQDAFHQYFCPFTEGFVYCRAERPRRVRQRLLDEQRMPRCHARADAGRGRRERRWTRSSCTRLAELCAEQRHSADRRRGADRQRPHRHALTASSSTACSRTSSPPPRAWRGGLPIGAALLGDKTAEDAHAAGTHGYHLRRQPRSARRGAGQRAATASTTQLLAGRQAKRAPTSASTLAEHRDREARSTRPGADARRRAGRHDRKGRLAQRSCSEKRPARRSPPRTQAAPAAAAHHHRRRARRRARHPAIISRYWQRRNRYNEASAQAAATCRARRSSRCSIWPTSSNTSSKHGIAHHHLRGQDAGHDLSRSPPPARACRSRWACTSWAATRCSSRPATCRSAAASRCRTPPACSPATWTAS